MPRNRQGGASANTPHTEALTNEPNNTEVWGPDSTEVKVTTGNEGNTPSHKKTSGGNTPRAEEGMKRALGGDKPTREDSQNIGVSRC